MNRDLSVSAIVRFSRRQPRRRYDGPHQLCHDLLPGGGSIARPGEQPRDGGRCGEMMCRRGHSAVISEN